MLAAGILSRRKFLRSISARDLTWWQAFEQVDGPIGIGPLVKLAALLLWAHGDGKEEPAGVLGWVEQFLETSEDDRDNEVLDEDDLDEEEVARRRRELELKIMQIFGHPELGQVARQAEDQ